MIDPGALAAQITKLTVEAMKAHNADRTGTLRLIKAALMNKALERNAALTPVEEQQTLTSMIKQRRDSIEQFTNGNRPELAAKEAAEIVIIEEFLPKAIDEAGLASMVTATLAELETTLGHKPGMKDMGPSMKAVQARLQSTGARADGRVVSELVKKSLAG
ncbi:MAG: GatB/YqeY domain-containing protein [Terracidiphilus sp.]